LPSAFGNVLLFCCRFPGTKQKVDTPAEPAPAKDDDEDDFELFGSDEEADEAAEKLKQERLAAYEAKKSKSWSNSSVAVT
jgi:Eukaryotic elongation factor 1 beta central acidic region